MSRYPSLLTLGLAFALAIVTGCTPEDEMLDFVESDIAKIKVDDLSRTMDFITSEVRFEQTEFTDQVVSGLNRWVTYSEDRLADVKWQRDPFAAPLFEKYGSLPAVERIDQYEFLNTDAYYLQQGFWLTRLVDRVKKSDRLQTFELYRLAAGDYRPDEDEAAPVVQVLRKLNDGLTSDADAEKLTAAVKWFDWICRNIQLESDAPLTAEEADNRRLDSSRETDAEAGVPGLGYQRFPWQSLMYGRGDYVERAKLFMVGLRYLDIDSVMLATGDEQRPWAVGVSLHGEYYLFDAKLALPLPGEKPGSIATLSEVRNKPELLSGLDLTTDESLTDNPQYWVRPDDVKQVVGLVYASPESMSKRMAGLESALVGDNRLLIAYNMQDMVDRLPTVEGVSLQPWDVAFKTHQYREAVRVAVEQSSTVVQDKLKWFYLTEAYVNGFNIYRTARGRFLLGEFKANPDDRALNSLEGWQMLMYDDDQIGSLGSDLELQSRHGIRKAGQSKQEFDNEVASVQGQMRLISNDAKFFLAQCLFDNNNENAAGNWLEVLRDNEYDDRWNEGVNYLLGRSLESRKQYDEALKVYGNTKLRQSHGNLIRGRIIKQLIESTYGSETAEPEKDKPADESAEASDKDAAAASPDDGNPDQ